MIFFSGDSPKTLDIVEAPVVLATAEVRPLGSRVPALQSLSSKRWLPTARPSLWAGEARSLCRLRRCRVTSTALTT